ncbi:hypothetical protein T439DRAFT_237976 [Meredithblackwellia eburnea MCA 4105]
MTSSFHNRTVSESFEAFDAILSEEVTRISALTQENATLRELLAERAHPDASKPTPPNAEELAMLDATKLQRELEASRLAQEEMARELLALRTSQATIVENVSEDHSSELELLRQSLATLASELEQEKQRAAESEAKRREEEDKVATLRSKVEESRRALMRIQGESSRKNSVPEIQSRRMSAGLYDTAPRRKSSLGLPPTPAGLGLGFGEASTSTLPPSKSATINRHRRGSASVSYTSTDSLEEDRMARFRDLRLGNTTTKVASRRSSIANGNDLLGGTELEFEPERRRIPSISIPEMCNNSICEEEGSEFGTSRPPSAPLRWQGRKHSMAVFDDVSRRSSLEVSPSPGNSFLMAPQQARSMSSGDRSTGTPSTSELLMQLEGLRIQLAESEEGRRASELCVKALKEFIASPNLSQGEGLMSLPPLPTDVDIDAPFTASPSALSSKRASTGSRWSIPRLPSIGRRESGNAAVSTSASSPNLTTYTPRRASGASTFPNLDKATPSTPAAPIFGSFSFSNLVNRQLTVNAIVDADTSPTMTGGESVSEFRNLNSTSPPIREESECESDISSTRAPSLTDSSASSESSRSSSPINDSPILLSDDLVRICEATFGAQGGLVAPEVVVDGKALSNPATPNPTTPTLRFGAAQ